MVSARVASAIEGAPPENACKTLGSQHIAYEREEADQGATEQEALEQPHSAGDYQSRRDAPGALARPPRAAAYRILRRILQLRAEPSKSRPLPELPSTGSRE